MNTSSQYNFGACSAPQTTINFESSMLIFQSKTSQNFNNLLLYEYGNSSKCALLCSRAIRVEPACVIYSSHGFPGLLRHQPQDLTQFHSSTIQEAFNNHGTWIEEPYLCHSLAHPPYLHCLASCGLLRGNLDPLAGMSLAGGHSLFGVLTV